jgi:hypothetical protein
MRFCFAYKSIIGICAFVSLSGCGYWVPDVQEVWDKPGNATLPIPLEFDIKEAVYCDIRKAVLRVFRPTLEGYTPDEFTAAPLSIVPKKTPKVTAKPFFKDYGIQVALTLTILESSSLSPGAAFNNPMAPGIANFTNKVMVSTPQSFSLGLGGTLNSNATRIDKFNLFYTVMNIYNNNKNGNDPHHCDENPETYRDGSSLLVKSDLKLPEWLQNALILEHIEPGTIPFHSLQAGAMKVAPVPGAPANPELARYTLTYETKFDVTTSGNVTPTWHLERISANPTETFFSLSRERTHDVTITFAPQMCQDAKGGYLIDGVCPSGSSSAVPIESAQNAQLASQIGLAVANNLSSLLLPAQ